VKGERVHVDEFGRLRLPEGGYGKDAAGNWFVRPPGSHMGELHAHSVTEHEDGTITVEPSIDGRDENGCGYHGHLIRGEWQAC
jgi:hypothetical protein